MRDSGCAGSWTYFHAGAVLPTLANLGAPKFLASVAMASPMTPTRSQLRETRRLAYFSRSRLWILTAWPRYRSRGNGGSSPRLLDAPHRSARLLPEWSARHASAPPG